MTLNEVFDLLNERKEDWEKTIRQPAENVPANIARGLKSKQTGIGIEKMENETLSKSQRSVRGLDFDAYVVSSSNKKPETLIKNYIAVFSKRKKDEGIGEEKIVYSILASLNKKVLSNYGISSYMFLKALGKHFDLRQVMGNIKFKSFLKDLNEKEQEEVLNEEAFEGVQRRTPTEKEMVEKGKGIHYIKGSKPATTPEGVARKYNRAMMVLSKKGSKGIEKKDEYLGSKEMMGLPRTDKDNFIASKGTSRFEIIKKLYKTGSITEKTVKRSTQLTPEQKEEILNS